MSDVPLLAGHAARLVASCRRLAVREEGAGTTLSYLMVLPLYLVTVYVIVEACLIHNARLGATRLGVLSEQFDHLASVVFSSSS
jgi:hypothetical protein